MLCHLGLTPCPSPPPLPLPLAVHGQQHPGHPGHRLPPGVQERPLRRVQPRYEEGRGSRRRQGAPGLQPCDGQQHESLFEVYRRPAAPRAQTAAAPGAPTLPTSWCRRWVGARQEQGQGRGRTRAAAGGSPRRSADAPLYLRSLQPAPPSPRDHPTERDLHQRSLPGEPGALRLCLAVGPPARLPSQPRVLPAAGTATQPTGPPARPLATLRCPGCALQRCLCLPSAGVHGSPPPP